MFFLISFVLANNYCVGETEEKCKNMCKNIETNFDVFFDEIPEDDIFDPNDERIHNIFIADNVTYYNSKHNFIFCDPSIYLVYPEMVEKMIIKDGIYVNSNERLKNVPLYFEFNYDSYIQVETDEKSNIKPFIIYSDYFYDYYSNFPVRFLTDIFPENLVTISTYQGYKAGIVGKASYLEKLFTNPEIIDTYEDIPYYCLSDKENKCEKYSSLYDLIQIDSIADLEFFSSYVLIVDTSEQVVVSSYCRLDFIHIIGMEGSDVTYYPNFQPADGDFYAIMHDDFIEMMNVLYEGEGKFTFSPSYNFSLFATTKTYKYDFTIKSREPFKKHKSYIYPLKEDYQIVLDKKINVPEYSLFHGPKYLSGLFEPGKFIDKDIFFDVTVDTLREVEYQNVTYYFTKGEHQIPKHWKMPCRFQGNEPSETNFIFDDVFFYTGEQIDNFIDVNIFPSTSYNKITIKPASKFYLKSFKNIYNKEMIEEYTILVEKDFYMTGEAHNPSYDANEISHDQCKIKGSGTIHFTNETFMNDVKEFCTYDDTIKFDLQKNEWKDYNICLGQYDINSCKAEIKDISNAGNDEWLWARHYRTIESFITFNYIYVADKYFFTDCEIQYHHKLAITPKAHLTIQYSNYSQITLYNDHVSIYYEDALMETEIYGQTSTSRLTIIHHYDHSNTLYDNNYEEIRSNKEAFQIYYKQPSTGFNIRFFFNYEKVKLIMKYVENVVPNSIELAGKCQMYIREPYYEMMSMFKVSGTIDFSINTDNDFKLILFSDKPIESDDFIDFICTSEIDKFNEYASFAEKSHIFKDISLNITGRNYGYTVFYFYGDITISMDVLDNSTITFIDDKLRIANNCIKEKDRFIYTFYFESENKYIIDVKNSLQIYYFSLDKKAPSIDFKTSLQSLEIFPNELIQNYAEKDLKINLLSQITITSPVPRYLQGLFGSTPIQFSKNWSYYHLSEDGKALYNGLQDSISFTNVKDDSNLPDNIVLAVGKNDVLSIPTTWQKDHNIYIYQYKGNDLKCNSATSFFFYLECLKINDKFQLLVGSLYFTVPEIIYLDTIISFYYYLDIYLYNITLDITGNKRTDVYMIYPNFVTRATKLCRIYSSDQSCTLALHSDDDFYSYYTIRILSISSNIYVTYRGEFDHICYSSKKEFASKCTGDYYIATDLNSLFAAVKSYPKYTIQVAEDLTIPFPTQDTFNISPVNGNIRIGLPYSAERMTITESDVLSFKYADSTVFNIHSKCIITAKLKDSIQLDINSNTDSKIIFSLGSDVFVSSESDFDTNFMISVNKNSYHLYEKNGDDFENIFGDLIEPFIQICAYDLNSISNCTFQLNNTIENVFKKPFTYNEVEIALSTESKEINLPSVSRLIPVDILNASDSILNISTVYDISTYQDSIIFDEFWQFTGNLSVLSLIKLNQSSVLSINDQIPTKITFQLTNEKSFIFLRNCDKQDSPKITLEKNGDKRNEIIILATEESYNNFIGSLDKYDDILILRDGTPRYLCLCNDENDCMRCKEGVDGYIDTAKTIRTDPGENVNIRVFSDTEISSNIFTTDHDVMINPNVTLNVTDTEFVDQNIERGINVDFLHFENGSNLLLKPTEISLNIEMRKYEMGPYFTIEMDTFLRLNVTNADEENIKSSRLDVNGSGELNCYNYPFDRIRPGDGVKIIKGVYFVCNFISSDYVCSFESVEAYKVIDRVAQFSPDFDEHSKILVFLDSFETNIYANLDDLKHQKIDFIRKETSKKRIRESNNKLKILSNSSAEITTCSNSTTSLSSLAGGASISNSDSDLFVFGFGENLTIKQEGDVPSESTAITIQPLNEEVTIIIDDSVDIQKQKLSIESDDDKIVNVKVISNKKITNEDLNRFIDTNTTKVSISLGDQHETGTETKPEKDKKKGFPIGGIIGIVVGVVVVIAAIVIVVIFVVKRKKNPSLQLSEKSVFLKIKN